MIRVLLQKLQKSRNSSEDPRRKLQQIIPSYSANHEKLVRTLLNLYSYTHTSTSMRRWSRNSKRWRRWSERTRHNALLEHPQEKESFKKVHTALACQFVAPIRIPFFIAQSKKWGQFIELFRAVIHNNPSLGNIRKIQYVLGYLQRAAKDAVTHLHLSRINHEAALIILEERFATGKQHQNI